MRHLTLLLLFPLLAIGAPNEEPNPKASQSIEVYSSNDGGDSFDNSVSNIRLINEYEAVAGSVGYLSLPECTDSSSGQTKDGGLMMARVNYICESVSMLKVQLELANGEIKAAKNCKDSPERQQQHLEAAHGYLNKAKEINALAVEYIEDRAYTASWGAWISDIWVWLAIIVLL